MPTHATRRDRPCKRILVVGGVDGANLGVEDGSAVNVPIPVHVDVFETDAADVGGVVLLQVAEADLSKVARRDDADGSADAGASLRIVDGAGDAAAGHELGKVGEVAGGRSSDSRASVGGSGGVEEPFGIEPRMTKVPERVNVGYEPQKSVQLDTGSTHR